MVTRSAGHIFTAQDEVEAWNEVPGPAFPDTPTFIDMSSDELAFGLISEEYNEAWGAWDKLEYSSVSTVDEEDEMISLAEFAGELADLVIVTLRAASAYGIDLDPIFRIVMDANWTKFVQDENGNWTALFREDGKILKGPNYDVQSKTQRLVDEIRRQRGVVETNADA